MIDAVRDWLSNLDFALVVVELTALAGVIWAFDVLFLRSARVARAARASTVGRTLSAELR